MNDVVYGGWQPRTEGIDKCKERYRTILRIIKIIKRGECRCRGLDLSQNHLKLEKKTKKEEEKNEIKKLWSEQDLNPRPSDYRSYT